MIPILCTRCSIAMSEHHVRDMNKLHDTGTKLGSDRFFPPYGLCWTCATRWNSKEHLLEELHDKIFPETNLRELDNIVWKISTGALICPLYTTGTDKCRADLDAVKLSCDYYCHDDLLYQMPSMLMAQHDLLGKSNWYAYRFPKIMYDGSRHVIGFLVQADYLLADYVEMTQDE